MSVANILSMAGGLGLFLFGIRTMGDGLENAAGAKLKRMLEVLTGNRFLAVLVGFVVTAIIQSSTATTVMVVGFVNAGMMSLAQAVGVIMGANIGTTVTSLLIALNFSSVAAAAVLVGVILMLASKKTVVKNLGAIFTGFGLLFLGIDMMSDSMAPLRESAGFMKFIVTVSESPLRPLFGIILGIDMTAVLQSSSASVGVLQTLAMQGLVPLKFSVFVLFGQNIGTCLTALFTHILRPYACLYLTYVSLVKQQHAQTALPYTSANAERQFPAKQLTVEIQLRSVLLAFKSKLAQQRLPVDSYSH